MRKFMAILGLVAIVLFGGFLGLRDPDIPFDTLVETYAAPPSDFLDLESGLTAHYRDRGPRDAPVVLLLHGSNASLFTWEPWVQELEADYRVISVDLIGHGLSSLSPGHDYSSAAYQDFLGEFIEAMNLERFALAGNSMGGHIAWRYALVNADKLDALVLLDASGIPRKPEEGRGLSPVYRLARTPVLNQLLLHILPQSTVEAQLKSAIYDDDLVTEEMVTRYHAFLLREGRRAATLARMQPSNEVSPVERLPEITTPTLILWGAEDTWVPVSGAHVFNEEIQGSTLILYDNVGHLPMEEIPEESVSDLKDFLEAVREAQEHRE